jgi:hypothetical protein
MQTRNLGGKNQFNILTTSVFSKNLTGTASPSPPLPNNLFELLKEEPFLLLNGGYFKLLKS